MLDNFTAQQLFNKTTLLQEIEKRYGVKISWSNLYLFEAKGWIKPSHYVDSGKRKMPVYTEQDLERFIATLKTMREVGKTRIKLDA